MGKKVKLSKDEGGYALGLVLILLILVGLIIGPLLLLMTTTLMSSYRHQEWMLGFYAADAGIEDAAYKIQHEDPILPAIGVSYPYVIEDEYGEALQINDCTVGVTIEGIDHPSDEVYKITSTATSDGRSTTVESYVKADRVDLSGFGDNAITTNGTVTIMPGSEVIGDIETDPEYWPTAEQLAAYFWEDVESLTPVPDGHSINISSGTEVDPYPIGPLSAAGDLTITGAGVARLDGTVYVKGDLTVMPNCEINLNGQSIFAEGTITFQPGCTVSGSGCIIAVGDVDFRPDMDSAPGDFVFVMSVEGTVWFSPSGDFYGSVAGDVEVQLQPGTTLTWVEPGEGFEWPAGGEAVLDIRTYTIQ